MLCENCLALRSDGYEYPEEYCMIQPEEKCYEFKNGYGCYLRESTIKKRVTKAEEAESSQWDGIAEWYVLTEEIEGRPEMLRICIEAMKECLGLRNESKYYKRHGRVFFAPMKNSISSTRTGEQFKALEKLKFCKLMSCDKEDDVPYWKYHEADMKEIFTYIVTPAGKKWLGEQINIDIKGAEKQKKR